MDYQACICFACQQRIEFPIEMAAQTINCPTCSQALILPAVTPPAVTEKRKSIFGGLLNIVDQVKERAHEISFQRECVKAMDSKLATVLDDGELEPHEAEQLVEALQFFGQSGFQLPQDKAREFFLKIVEGIHWREDSDGLVMKLKEAFGVYDVAPAASAMMNRKRAMFALENGEFPALENPGMILKPGEFAYWSEPGAMAEVKVVRRSYQGGSRGVSIRVMKGVSFRVGAHRGQSVNETDLVHVSEGNLIITNKRFYFAGNRKTFSVKISDLDRIEFADDGIVIFENGREKPRIVQLANAARGEIVKAAFNGIFRKVKSSIEVELGRIGK
jgi:hypothetical protein